MECFSVDTKDQCIVLQQYFYIAPISVHTNQRSEALSVQETQERECSLEITKRGTWLTR